MYETDLKVWRGALDQAEVKAAMMQQSYMEMQREISFVKVCACLCSWLGLPPHER
jgi:hypothetical protein